MDRIGGTITVLAVAGLLDLLAEMMPTRTTAQDAAYATVSYCELVRNAEQYNGKLVRVSAIYR